MNLTPSYDLFSFVLGIIVFILFNPLVWLIGIALVIARRHKRKHEARSNTASSNQFSINPDTLPDDHPLRNRSASVATSEETASTLLNEMALRTSDQLERDVLERAAYSLRHKLRYLVPRSAYHKQTGVTPAAPQKSFIINDALTTAKSSPTETTLPPEPAIPLSERGLKALQNINVLLYLGAFFVVVAASIFAATTSQAIGAGGQVIIMGLVTAAFFLTGLGLYRYTNRIKPAGVTFTAISLLLAPLVGVAAQSLLFAGRNPAPVWLATSAVMLIMQVIAFATIRQTYIAYFASLTTISLLQSLLATAKAELFWFGWIMLLIAMTYAVTAKFLSDRKLSQPLEIVAQVFVPLSVILALIAWPIFGAWHVGVQFLLAATFYLICMALRDFDASDNTQAYLWIAASLLPIGLTMTLTGRKVPLVAVFATLWVIAICYVLAEKYALHDRHCSVYEWLSGIMMLIAPFLFVGPRFAWAVVAATAFHAIHYLMTRKQLSYGLFLASFSVMPSLLITRVIPTDADNLIIGFVYVIMSFVGAPIAQLFWKKHEHPNYAQATRVATLLWSGWAVIGMFAGNSVYGTSAALALAGLLNLYYVLTDEPIHIAIAVAAWNAAVVTLGLQKEWPSAIIAAAILGVSIMAYGYRWLPQLRAQRREMLILTLVNISLAFAWGMASPGSWGKAISLVAGLTVIVLALGDEDPGSLSLGVIFSYVSVISLAVSLKWATVWLAVTTLGLALAIYGLKYLHPSLGKWQGFPYLYGAGLAFAYFASFANIAWPNILVKLIVIGTLVVLSYTEQEDIPSALAWLALLGITFPLADRTGWWLSPTLMSTSLLLYGYGSAIHPDSRRSQLARWVGILGSFGTIGTNTNHALPSWLPVTQNYISGALTLAESYKMRWRPGKYIGSATLWLVTLQAYNVAGVTASQVYMQTTAAYFAALAYRFYQRGERQTQDILTATALGFATIPLAIQALDDQTGGYVLGILGMGIVILLIGLATHYTLVRTWGIATLIIIALYKTSGSILQLPAWVWFGVIGLCILAGAIYLLSRRNDPNPKS